MTSQRVAALCVRVSTNEQDTQRQITAVRRIHETCYPELRAVEFFEEDGVSATKIPIFERPQGKALCDLIEGGGVEVVIADEQSRLVRGPSSAEWAVFYDLCCSHATTCHTELDGVIGDDESSELLAMLRAWDARREIKKLNHRLRGKLRERADKGLRHGGSREFGLTDAKTLAPVESALVERMLRERASGRSFGMIARDLHREGVLGTRDAPLSPRSVSKICASPTWGGFIRSHDRLIADTQLQVPEHVRDLWLRVNADREVRMRTPGRGCGRVAEGFVCTGVGPRMVCATHEARYYRRGRLPAYICGDKAKFGGDCPNVKQPVADRALIDIVLEQAVDLDSGVEQFEEQAERTLAEIRGQIRQVEQAIDASDRRLVVARRKLVDEVLGDGEYQEIRDGIEVERELACARLADLRDREQAVAALRASSDAADQVVAWIRGFAADLRAGLASPEEVQQARVTLGRVIDHVVVHPGDTYIDAGGVPVIDGRLALGNCSLEIVWRHDLILSPPSAMVTESGDLAGSPYPELARQPVTIGLAG